MSLCDWCSSYFQNYPCMISYLLVIGLHQFRHFFIHYHFEPNRSVLLSKIHTHICIRPMFKLVYTHPIDQSLIHYILLRKGKREKLVLKPHRLIRSIESEIGLSSGPNTPITGHAEKLSKNINEPPKTGKTRVNRRLDDFTWFHCTA